jgi:plastocyanin
MVAFVLAVAGVIGALAFGVGAPPAKPVTAVSAGAPAPTPESVTRAAAAQVAVSDAASEAPIPSPAPKPVASAPKRAAATASPKPKPAHAPKSAAKSKSAATAQHISIAIGQVGYEPSVVRAAAGRPITLTVGKGEGCAAGFQMPSLGVDKDNSAGSVSIELGVLRPGTYRFSCAMGMVEGKLVVR